MEIMTPPPKKRKAVGDSPTAHKTIEKRRRDRINESLNVLRTLVPAARKTQGVKNDKVELLKMTIEYLREQQGKGYEPALGMPSRSGQVTSPTTQETEAQVRLGMEDCIQDVRKFLMEVEGMGLADPQLVSVLSHLRCWVATNLQPVVDQFHSRHNSHNTIPLAHESHLPTLPGAVNSGIGLPSKLPAATSVHSTSTVPSSRPHSSAGRPHASVPVLTSPQTSVPVGRSAAGLPSMPRTTPQSSQLASPPQNPPRNDITATSAPSSLIKSEYSSGLDLISTVSMAVEQPVARVSSDATAPAQATVPQRPVSVLLQQPPCASGAYPVVQPAQTVTVVPAPAHTLVAPPPLAVSNQSPAPPAPAAAQPNIVQPSPARLPTAATVYIHPASVLAAGTTQISAGGTPGWATGGSVIGQMPPTATTIAATGNIAAQQVLANPQPMHMTALPIAPTGGYLSFWPSQPAAYIAAPAATQSSATTSQQPWQQ